jgi:hypothetical protein
MAVIKARNFYVGVHGVRILLDAMIWKYCSEAWMKVMVKSTRKDDFVKDLAFCMKKFGLYGSVMDISTTLVHET